MSVIRCNDTVYTYSEHADVRVRKKERDVFGLHDSALQTSTYKVTAVVHVQLLERWLDFVSTT